MEEVTAQIDELYSICGYKTNKDFELLNQIEEYEIYGKRKGKIGNENSYFVEENYYGKICIVKKDLTIEEWRNYYNKISKKDENELTYDSYESE